MQYLGAFFSKVFYENKLIGAKIAVVKVDLNFDLLGRDILNIMKKFIDRCFGTAETVSLPAVKGLSTSIKLKRDTQPMFWVAKKVPLQLERKVDQAVDEFLSLGILFR